MFRLMLICCIFLCATGSFCNEVENAVNDTSPRSYIFDKNGKKLSTDYLKNKNQRSEDIKDIFDIDEEKNKNEKDYGAQLGFDITTETSHEFHYITIVAEVTSDINNTENTNIKGEAEYMNDKKEPEITSVENETENDKDEEETSSDENDGENVEINDSAGETGVKNADLENKRKAKVAKFRAESRGFESEAKSADDKIEPETTDVENETNTEDDKTRAESLDNENEAGTADNENKPEDVEVKNKRKSKNRAEGRGLENEAQNADDKNKTVNTGIENETKTKNGKNRSAVVGEENELESTDDKNKTEVADVEKETKSRGTEHTAEGVDVKNETKIENADVENEEESAVVKNKVEGVDVENATKSKGIKRAEEVDVKNKAEGSLDESEVENTNNRSEDKPIEVKNEAEDAFDAEDTEDENSSDIHKESEKYSESFDNSKNDSFRNTLLNPRKFCFPLFRSNSNVKLNEKVANSPYYRRVQFKLWTIENPEVPAIRIFGTNKLHFPEFNPSRKTVVLIHGIHNKSIDYLDEFFENFRKAMLYSDEGYNILAVDYSSAVLDDSLNSARGKAVFIAQHIARGLKDLRFVNCDNLNDVCKPTYTFLIGHELGAFIAGVVASEFQQNKIERLMGLSPTFFKNPLGNNWSVNSAKLVEVIYSANCEKPPENVSHRAFYINSGYYPQKSCDSDPYGYCSINMAFNAYYFSMTERSFQFSATLCPSYEEYIGGNCDTFPTLPLYNNIQANDAVMGNYYLTWSNKFRLEKGKVSKSSPHLNYHIQRLSKTL